jgi:SNF2 family DNA or RNA helicase
MIMPPNNIYLDLSPEQRNKYEQLRRGIIEIIRREGTKVTHAKAGAAFTYGSMICSGLAALGEEDGPGSSVKLDWLERFIEDAEEKVISYIGFKGNVAALEQRLFKRGIGFATITGDVSKKDRDIAQERLFDDPQCKVLIGTNAIEMSLNLQAARHLINVDTILNPARMTQIAGRYKRVGSRFRTLYLHNLYAAGTQEERYQDRLRKEQAIANAVWDGKSEIYEELSALERMQLILS